jgi:gluconolactonase
MDASPIPPSFRRRLAGLAALLMPVMLGHAADPLPAPGARLERVANTFAFTEGPSADKAGNVFFTDQPNDRIVRWDAASGALTDWLKPAGRANGTYFDTQGNLLACADDLNELWSISPDKKVTVLVKDIDGKFLNGPNDLWIRPDGGLYFTDPLYPRPYWKRAPATQMPGQHVYFLAADRKGPPRAVATDLKQPNGIIGTPDGKTLYVADIGAARTYAFTPQPDGSLADKRLFCELGSDGMTLDREGNLYLTGRGVTVFDRAGTQIERITVPEPWTANVTFGGPDRDILFITAGKSVYTLKLRVKGAQ